MILQRLTMTNFCPFNGTHPVDLSVSPEAPVILIHGENERGKTSFANAIRWALYGRAIGRSGRDVATWELMNSEAVEAGTCNMSVRLEFEHDDLQYELERHAQASLTPTSDADITIIETLKRAGHVQATEHIPVIIGDILHHDISRFFLFDGEMLSDYEDLLSAKDGGSTLVRESIERILGVPALQHAARDLEALRSKTENQQVNQVQKRRKNERVISATKQVEEELAALVKDIAANTEHKGTLEDHRDNLRAERRKYAAIEAEAKQLDDFEGDVLRLETEQEEARDECRRLLARDWWMPVEALVASARSAAETEANEARARATALRETTNAVERLRRMLADDKCQECGQSIDEALKERVAGRLKKSEEDLDQLGEPRKDDRRAQDVKRLLEDFSASSSLDVLAAEEKRVRSLGLRIRSVDRRASDIRRRLKDHDRAEIKRNERDYDECITRLSDNEKVLTDLRTDEKTKRGALERYRRQIRQMPEASTALAEEAGLYECLREVMTAGIDAFRTQVRKDVEAEATKIHQRLTTEPEYAGLTIDDGYGLLLTNKDGRTITRSAGSEQIVALSLIGALSRCAAREGPIVMDTPFGRLDIGHRRNILRFAPDFGPQVILLVQSGELERQRDLGHLEGKVCREFRILRDGASDRSIIEAIVNE